MVRSLLHPTAPLPAAALTLLLLAFALGGCRPPQEGGSGSASGGGNAGPSIEVAVVDAPRLGPAQLRITVLRDGEPVEGATVEVVGDMTHAGMVPVLADATDAGGETGVYLTEGFEFTMAGDWVLTVDVAFPDGTEVEETVFVSVPAP